MQTLSRQRARRALLLALGAGLVAFTAFAAAAGAKEPPKSAKPRKPSTKIKFEKDSSESTAERDRRLWRECQGRPNAGACLGYAH
jgi:hypothetical protein